MNNIEILEEFIKHYKEVQEKYKDDKIQAEIERSCYFEEVPAKAIENLINRNRTLEKEIKLMKSVNLEDNYIPKSKIKEKIEELEKERKRKDEEDTINPFYDQIDITHIIEVLQELLEGE